MKIISAPDYESMSRKAANLISAQVILQPASVLGLATGSTPVGIYRQLADWYRKGDIDFSRVHTVNLDEYCGLSADSKQSYHSYMQDNFFRYVNIPAENCSIPDGNAVNVEEECERYDKLISKLCGIDLQLLGIGHTGHIGFNEPGQNFDQLTHYIELDSRTVEANARFFENTDQVPKAAITMGIKAIMQAKKLLLVADGIGKADILYRTLFGPVTPVIPASILQFHSDLTVVATEDALSVIRRKRPDVVINYAYINRRQSFDRV